MLGGQLPEHSCTAARLRPAALKRRDASSRRITVRGRPNLPTTPPNRRRLIAHRHIPHAVRAAALARLLRSTALARHRRWYRRKDPNSASFLLKRR